MTAASAYPERAKDLTRRFVELLEKLREHVGKHEAKPLPSELRHKVKAIYEGTDLATQAVEG